MTRKRGWPATVKTFRTKRDAAEASSGVGALVHARHRPERILLQKGIDYLPELGVVLARI